ncbi:hypothetical protein J6590_007295 [Homalodisca vitripennis]|nr:hypothetical protein J6590_007295 [Homalodisca vitripennis]
MAGSRCLRDSEIDRIFDNEVDDEGDGFSDDESSMNSDVFSDEEIHHSNQEDRDTDDSPRDPALPRADGTATCVPPLPRASGTATWVPPDCPVAPKARRSNSTGRGLKDQTFARSVDYLRKRSREEDISDVEMVIGQELMQVVSFSKQWPLTVNKVFPNNTAYIIERLSPNNERKQVLSLCGSVTISLMSGKQESDRQLSTEGRKRSATPCTAVVATSCHFLEWKRLVL